MIAVDAHPSGTGAVCTRLSGSLRCLCQRCRFTAVDAQTALPTCLAGNSDTIPPHGAGSETRHLSFRDALCRSASKPARDRSDFFLYLTGPDGDR
jgi:hypothetical protein